MDTYEDVCSTAASSSSNDARIGIEPQESSAYENTAFVDDHVKPSRVKAQEQVLYEEMSPKPTDDHTYTLMRVSQ